MDLDVDLTPDLLKSALNYGKRYVNRTVGEILRSFTLKDLIEDEFPFRDN
jgi:hypothetical protein